MKYEIYNIGVIFVLAASLWIFLLGRVQEAIYIAILANAIKNFLSSR